MELLGVGFLLGILGAGFGAVLAQHIEDRAVDGRLRAALLAEVEENLVRLGHPDQATGIGRAPIVRSAWDAARSIRLKAEQSAAVAKAYSSGDRLRLTGEVLDATIANITQPNDYTVGQTRMKALSMLEANRIAYALFEAARFALGGAEPTLNADQLIAERLAAVKAAGL